MATMAPYFFVVQFQLFKYLEINGFIDFASTVYNNLNIRGIICVDFFVDIDGLGNHDKGGQLLTEMQKYEITSEPLSENIEHVETG